MVSNKKDSQGFENSYNSYERCPLEKFFIFTIFQNYTLALTVKDILIIFLTRISHRPQRHSQSTYSGLVFNGLMSLFDLGWSL